jgi:UDP-3-O-[3-hydroxymyristoyl] glucosamine N-acyltransferase
VTPFSASQVCDWIEGQVTNATELGPRLDQIRVDRPAGLAGSKSNQLAFFFNRIYQSELATAAPGILITGEPFVKPLAASGLPLWKSSAVIACKDPYLALAILSEKFAEQLSTVVHTAQTSAAEVAENGGKPQVHPLASVDPTAELGAGVQIGANAVIEAGARIGIGTVIYPGCYVGPGCVLGERCVLFPNVTLYEWVVLGNRVRIHAGSVIGSDGFGYAPKLQMTDHGPVVTGHQKIYHLGRVIIGDEVEIGAGSCVDRGTITDTRIERSAKIDNQVHIGHNSLVDEGAIICGATALAGNASVGKFAYVGGITGITNHVHIGDGAKVGAMTLVTKDVAPGGTAVGSPQRDHKEHFRAHAWLSRAVVAGRKSPHANPKEEKE